MALIKKILLFSGIALFVVVLLLSGIGLYLYYHPDQIKPMIERSLSASTGASCTIKTLSYSFKPMVLEARGILFKPLKPKKTFSMEVHSIRADMKIDGPWGHRSLILKNLQINGVYLDLFSEHVTFPGNFPVKRGPSFPANTARRLISFFFFRNIRFGSGELLDGRISAVRGDQAFQVIGIHAIAGDDKPLSLSFALKVENSSRNMNFTAPNVNILGSQTLDIKNLKFSGTLESQDMRLRDSELNIKNIEVFSKFTYSHSLKNLDIENLKVRCEGVALGSDLKKIGSSSTPVTAAESLSMETGLVYDITQGEAAFVPLKLHISGLSVKEKTDTFLKPLDIDLKAGGISSKYPVIEIRDTFVQIPRVKINTGKQDILIKDIRMHVPDGRIDTTKRSVLLPKVRLETVGLKNLLLDIRLQDRDLNLLLQGKETSIFDTAAAYHLVPPDWDIKVHDSIRINITGPQPGPWLVKAKLSLDDLVFQNKNGSVMGENVSLGTEIESVVDLKHSRITFAADMDARTGEVLYDRYYLNLKKYPIVTSCNGTYDLQKRLIELPKFRFNLKGILPLEIHGFLKQGPSKANADFMVVLPKVPLKPICHHFLLEPYTSEKPFLATLDTEGTVSAQIRINGSRDAWQIKGRFGWLGGKFFLPEKKIALEGIHADMPVWYQTKAAISPVKTLSGKLEVESITVPLLTKQPLSIQLDAGPNRISVDSETVIKVPGGDLRLGTVLIERLFAPDLTTIQTRLKFEKIKLHPLLSKIWMHHIDGTLAGTLNPIRYENHVVTTQGKLNARVFGGNIIVSDLGATGLFTSAPVFKLNVKWEDLLLSEMTTDTAFGKIEGVLKGHLRDVEMAYGQPQRFNLLLETVKTKGIPQKISVKAVENIAQIGGGQSPFIGLAGAFASFFKTFPYKKIGIKANLENDVFTVNGTIREGGIEYLVKRGSFSGVDIINQNPDNRISFKDMVKRIKRIGSKGGPVVK